jgi:hypothetical protein
LGFLRLDWSMSASAIMRSLKICNRFEHSTPDR